MQIRMAGGSDIGRVRKNNQDSFYFDAAHGVVIVADGIGGRKGGEIASKIAVDGMRDSFLESDVLRPEEIRPFLTSAVERVNQSVMSQGEIQSEYRGMGTTLNSVFFMADHAHIAHVGDSRTYLIERGGMWQLSIDHNIETFISRGWMKREDLAPGTRDSALVKSVGLTERCEVDLYSIKLREGQIFVTCSDGLTGMVGDRRILEVVKEHVSNLNRLPKALIDEANRNGGKDNITVVTAQVRSV
jgi:serine/threonine protein phosphatase PrpC